MDSANNVYATLIAYRNKSEGWCIYVTVLTIRKDILTLLKWEIRDTKSPYEIQSKFQINL